MIPPELIGEEIYDEFDQHGAHGDPYVPAPDASLNPQPKAKEDADVGSAIGTSKLLAPSPTLKPIAFKGLSFLRSRSAPPTPREENALVIPDGSGHAVDAMPTVAPNLVANSHTAHRAARPPQRTSSQPTISPPELHGPAMGHEERVRHAPSIIIEQGSPDPSPTDEEAHNLGTDYITMSRPVHAAPRPSTAPGLAAPQPTVSGPLVRTASAAASLEAILLERKRRLTASTGTGSGAHTPAAAPASVPNLALPAAAAVAGVRAAAGPGTPAAKGTRFKSSPLGGGERGGVVVAEKVKGDSGLGAAGDGGGKVEDEDVKGGNEKGRIPSGRDKEGPDKGM